MGECFFWYQPTRVVLDKRPLNGCARARVCTQVNHCKSQLADEKYSLKGARSGSDDLFRNSPCKISPQWLTLETSDFVHGSAMCLLCFDALVGAEGRASSL